MDLNNQQDAMAAGAQAPGNDVADDKVHGFISGSCSALEKHIAHALEQTFGKVWRSATSSASGWP